MQKITEIIKKKFTVSAEVVPPRNGSDPKEILDKIKSLKGKVDFISVTKGAGGSLRGGTLPLSLFAKEQGVIPVAHFVCRERTKAEIENEVIDYSYLGINNILALRGDPPAGAKDEEWDGDYRYAYKLVEQINNLNYGRYIPRKNIDKTPYRQGIKTDFCILVAGHPEDPIEQEIKHIKEKIGAGAQVIMTQMIFSFDEYKSYVEALKENCIDLPVIAGVRPLVSLKQAESVERFFGLKVNTKIKEILKNAKSEQEAREKGIRYTKDMISRLKQYGAAGAHLFILDDFRLVEEIKDG